MEERKIQTDLMSEEEFANYISNNLHLMYYAAVGKYKSVKRAMRRGLVTREGLIMPVRPFNNRKNTCKRGKKQSRPVNEEKKVIYARLKDYRKRIAG